MVCPADQEAGTEEVSVIRMDLPLPAIAAKAPQTVMLNEVKHPGHAIGIPCGFAATISSRAPILR